MSSNIPEKINHSDFKISPEEAHALAEQLKEKLGTRDFQKTNHKLTNLMIAGLGDDRGLVRRTFAESLGIIGSSALPGLFEVLKNSPNVIARRAAAKTLKLVGDPNAVPYLLEALMNDTDPVVQGSAAGAMAIFGKAAIDALLKVISNSKSSSMQCGLASWALSFAGGQAPDELKNAAKSNNPAIKTAAIAAFGDLMQTSYDKELENILLNALNDNSPDVRIEATRLVININNTQLIEEILSKKINDTNLLVRRIAAIYLMKLDTPNAIKILNKRIHEEKENSVKEVINLAVKKLSNPRD
ncbi:HEAT repeat domain-containing protein [Prochlorococcus sp. MIT 1223]|uniref:HEAT repeat domain-containing protein n=1 Tax=Prochlorococcus sp. MIT 1223 TaxID=3096217 RepID=UPI002A76675C|nr:HEAT repeat domain-containing protein [Prochlorococcus sp. MIT 1223]